MSSHPRKIIHCDCDCFYAAVETRDDPRLRGKPVAVGGRPDQRGVVATCNYEAREFGVRSAMAASQALQCCPGLIVLPPAMEKYRTASRQILAIYRYYTELVEPLSLDEAYLDVSDALHCRGSATLMARAIRTRIADDVGITASAGIAPNKFVAKVASDWNKPDGQHVVLPDQVDAFVVALSVKKIFGVGAVTAAKLNRLGAGTCADLRAWPLIQLQQHFGKFGTRLYELVRGVDDREVCPSRERKSISVEETYNQDLPDLAACETPMRTLVEQLVLRVQRNDAARYVRKLTVKIRFADFRQTSVECVGTAVDLPAFRQLLETGFGRGMQPVRLLGAGVRLMENAPDQQMGLFGGDEEGVAYFEEVFSAGA